MKKINVGDVFVPNCKNSSVSWKNCKYLVVQNIYSEFRGDAPPTKLVYVVFKNEKNVLLEENIDFIKSLVKGNSLTKIEDETEKAKVLLVNS